MLIVYIKVEPVGFEPVDTVSNNPPSMFTEPVISTLPVKLLEPETFNLYPKLEVVPINILLAKYPLPVVST